MPKISDLDAATSVDPTDTLVIVQGGVTKKAEASLLLGASTATTNSSVETETVEVDVAAAGTEQAGTSITVDEDESVAVTIEAHIVRDGAATRRSFVVEREILNNGGSVAASTQTTLKGPSTVSTTGGNLDDCTADIDYSAGPPCVVTVNLNGNASVGTRWRVDRSVVRITAAAGSGLDYDPAILTLTGWWRAGGYDPATGTWTGVASAGTSGSNNLTQATAGFRPTAGTALNGRNAAAFARASTQRLTHATLSDFFADTNFAGWILCKSTDIVADDANALLDEGLVQDGVGFFGVGLRATGPGVALRHYTNTPTSHDLSGAWANGAWRLIFFRHDGTNIQLSSDAGANFTSDAAAGVGSPTGALIVGANYDQTVCLNGEIAEIGLLDATLDDATCANIKTYVEQYHGITL